MKDVDRLSRNIGPLIHRYLVQSYTMRAEDTAQQPFVYCRDTFTSYLIHVVSLPPTQPLSQKSSSTLPPLPTVHHSSINFISAPILQSVPSLRHKPPILHHIVPPENILWWSFDSVSTSLDPLLSHWTDGSIRHYIFENDLRHYHLSTFLSSSPQPKYTKLSHLFYHLQLLKKYYYRSNNAFY